MGATTATGAADRRRTTLTAAVLAAGLALACGGDGGSDAAPDAGAAVAGEAEACGPLEIVVVNDDGVGSPALDLLAERLTADDRFEAEVTIVVPAGERSGTGDATTPGGAPHDEAATPGGAPARVVDGYPADAVAVALDDLALDPHLVVSGINLGQNVGPLVDVSGTIGAARTALRRGVPALAVSAGLAFDEAQFEAGADLAADWIAGSCDALAGREAPTDALASINVPACPPERMGPLQEVPRAAALREGEDVFTSTCDLADPAPADDVAAIRAGYPALTLVDAEP